MKKDKQWLKEKIIKIPPVITDYNELWNEVTEFIERKDVIFFINQLDEPEVLTQEWIDEHTYHEDEYDFYYADPDELKNLLVPKQEEVDQAYKDGYEKGKQHTFYKGYLEGLADKENEPETVADVISDFWKSFERLKEVMSMEVEELEE